MTRRGALGLALVFALGAGGACKKKNEGETTSPNDANGSAEPDPAAATPTTETPKLTIRVTSDEHGNEGRPLYAVVREVKLKEFVEDRYQDIAALVIEPDESVLASFLVFPGTARDITIDKPKGKTVGVYLLLTKANGTSWKRLFEEPESISVVVGRDRLLTPEQKGQRDAIEAVGQ